MQLAKLLTLTEVSEGTWKYSPKSTRFWIFKSKIHIHNSKPTTTSIVRWFKVLNTDDGDPVLLLQNRTYSNNICPGTITYDGESDIHQIFYISDITGISFK